MKLTPRNVFLIHFLINIAYFGIILVYQIVVYPILNLSTVQFEAIHRLYLFHSVLFLSPIIALDIVSGILLVRGIPNLDFHRLARGEITLAFAQVLITIVFEIPVQFTLWQGKDELSLKTLAFVNIVRLITEAIRLIYLLKMIKFFYAFDTIYEYDGFE